MRQYEDPLRDSVRPREKDQALLSMNEMFQLAIGS